MRFGGYDGETLMKEDAFREKRTPHLQLLNHMRERSVSAKYTDWHRLLVQLARRGNLLRLYTQNVDDIEPRLPGLETAVPLRRDESGSWPRTVQLHRSSQSISS